MRTYAFILLMAAVLVGGLVLQHRRIRTLQADNADAAANISVLLSELDTLRSREGLSVARTTALRLTAEEYGRYRREDARLIEELRGRCEELERAASAGTATRVEVRTVVRDSIVRDTVLPCLSYDDGWMSLSGCVEDGVFDGSVMSRDTLLLFCNVRYRRFLWWKTGRVKSRTWRVVSRNPHTAMCGYEVVEIAQ